MWAHNLHATYTYAHDKYVFLAATLSLYAYIYQADLYQVLRYIDFKYARMYIEFLVGVGNVFALSYYVCMAKMSACVPAWCSLVNIAKSLFNLLGLS